MTRTTSDLINSLTRPVRFWSIKVVPDAEPNADGEWIEVGTHQLRPDISFDATVHHFATHCPLGHHVVAVNSSD